MYALVMGEYGSVLNGFFVEVGRQNWLDLELTLFFPR